MAKSKKKTQKDLTKKVMSKIRKEKITMRPRIYFVVGSLLLGIGMAGAVILAILFINLSLFRLRVHSPFGYLLFGRFGIRPFLRVFPWLPLLVALGGIFGGLSLLKKYDISYKKSFKGLAISLLVMILVFGFLLSRVGFNEKVGKIRQAKNLYGTRFRDKDFVAGRVVEVRDKELELVTPEGDRVKVLIDKNTLLPRGGDFKIGDMIRVVGEHEGETFTAKGIVKGGMPLPSPQMRDNRIKNGVRDFRRFK